MGLDYKKIVLIESVVIVFLLIFFIHDNFSQISLKFSGASAESTDDLLSPRIYSGLLEPQSLLILNFKPLEDEIKNYISSNNVEASVYVLNLRDGASMGVNEDISVEPASLNKLPIAMIILKNVEQGELSLDTQVEIKNSYKNSKSGTLYNENIQSLTIRELLYYMLSESDNTATNALLSYVDIGEIESLSSYLGYYVKAVNITSPESNSFQVTPQSTGNLFISLYLSTLLEPRDSAYILELLTNTSFNIHEYARLPSDLIIAQKYGSYHNGNSDFFHSCGIVYLDSSRFFYCVMTEDLDREEASKVVGDILHEVYQYFLDTRTSLEDYKL